MLMPAIFDGDLFDDLFDDMFAPDRAARPLKPMERIGFPVNGLMKTDVKETDEKKADVKKTDMKKTDMKKTDMKKTDAA